MPISRQPLTEGALVTRYCQFHKDTRWHLGQFYRWADGHWSPLPAERVHHELYALLDRLRAKGDLPAGSLRRLHRLVFERVRLALSHPEAVQTNPAAAFACANGLLDPSTGQFRPCDREEFAPLVVPYAFDPAARAPAWEAFLQSRLPACADFLQEFAGYCLTPDTRHELALWLHGCPGSGKSTFLHGLQVLLGRLAGPLDPAALLAGRFSPDSIQARHLLFAAEPSRLDLSDVFRFNAFVSGEPLVIQPARYQSAVTVSPVAKLIWAFTSLPPMPDPASPLFRRLAIVPFPPLDTQPPDASLKSRFEAEGPGLLNWALAGLQRLTARGRFDLPAPVVAATRHYQLESDLPALFLADHCDRGPDLKASAAHLHAAYLDWCRANGHPGLSSTLLARHWERLGLVRRRAMGGSVWFGACLKAS